ncbi:hypothetical protein K1719_004152 [Acacia pycnantha]|nr:hypothetical protein K1719_004152 [Acacia pycnantha]
MEEETNLTPDDLPGKKAFRSGKSITARNTDRRSQADLQEKRKSLASNLQEQRKARPKGKTIYKSKEKVTKSPPNGSNNSMNLKEINTSSDPLDHANLELLQTQLLGDQSNA